MKIETRVIETEVIKFCEEESEALNFVYAIIEDIQNSFSDEDILQNINTGECIRIDELARVKGILSGLIEGYHWELI